MSEKPAPEFTLAVIDIGAIAGAMGWVIAGLVGSAAVRAACLGALGGALVLFAWSPGEEQRALIDRALHLDRNPVTDLLTHPHLGRVLFVVGLLMIGAAVAS